VKVGVVGVGAVGAATALSLIERGGMCRELVVVDRTMERAKGVATDLTLRHAAVPDGGRARR
jgi:L-lactate dehydrogenase